ncbi:hypothetical protein OH779_40135 [Actinacidiphila glaucinigra]|uniref:hypothetical protein n=1 Tax=Actinacidiphila glaucinigra TaxID=235986 RepID=UPI003864720F
MLVLYVEIAIVWVPILIASAPASRPEPLNPRTESGTTGTLGAMKSLNLRFRDDATYEAIKAAAARAGVSLQEYIETAAVDRALARQKQFVDAALQHRDAIAEAFAEIDPADGDPKSSRNLLGQAKAAMMDVESDSEPHGNAA